MPELPPPTSAPAGWYPDPYTGGRRYFDGRAWAPYAVPDPHWNGTDGRPPAPVLEERVEHPRLPVAVAVGALAILLVSLFASRIVVEALVRYEWPVVVYVVIAVGIGYVPSLLWGWYVRRRWGSGKLTAIGWRFRWADLGWGPLTWLSAVVTQIGITALVLAFDVPISSNVDDVGLDVDRAYVIATAIAAVVAAPVVEEIVFRGLVLRGLLSRMPAVVAVTVQGVLFGAAHVDPVRGTGNIGLVLVLSGVGIAFGTSAYLARRLGPTVVAHAIFNGVVLAIVLSGLAEPLD
jgi:membrane protease YdiL (CAAX protease family)